MLPIKLVVVCHLDSFLSMFRVAVFQEYVTEDETIMHYIYTVQWITQSLLATLCFHITQEINS
jgi:hypothetical protein